MPSFGELWVKSKGKPVIYNGQKIWHSDRFKVADGQRLKVTFESVNSDWRQGISLDVDGNFTCNGQTIKKKIILWQHTAPREFIVTVHSKKGEVDVWNTWDTGNGVTEALYNGAAMIIEEINETTKRYRCNDGRPDDDFDDLIFTIELLK